MRRVSVIFRACALLVGLLALACSETIVLTGDGGSGVCQPGGPQCNDCEDNDNDGLIDGFDPECTGARDDDEGSFATGIPGDNQNRVDQDCFFDGNSGAGNDGCDLHICCLLDLGGAACPDEFRPQSFDPNNCQPSNACIENCEPLAPPGCDCFGCCTVCSGANCADILISPVISPDCDTDNLADETACRRCVKTDCGASCDPAQCILCPGQSESDLPPGCELSCPTGSQVCSPQVACPAGEFCANGCCIGIPE